MRHRLGIVVIALLLLSAPVIAQTSTQVSLPLIADNRPSSTPTLAIVPSPSSSSTATSTNIPTATTTQEPITNRIVNPGFEQGSAGWIFEGAQALASIEYARSGVGYAQMGGATTGVQYISQRVIIPNVNTTLGYWHQASAEFTLCDQVIAYVWVDRLPDDATASREIVDTVQSFCQIVTPNYVLRTVNLSGFAGQSVELGFELHTVESNDSTWILDDIMLPRAEAPTVTPMPVTPTRDPRTCDPAYPTVCIPPPPPDLNCGDIPYQNFVVLPPDPHGFDTDNDGVGCEA